MVDYFSLALTHALMALAVWRLLLRDDLDQDPDPTTDGAASGPGRQPNRQTGRSSGVRRELRLPVEGRDVTDCGPANHA